MVENDKHLLNKKLAEWLHPKAEQVDVRDYGCPIGRKILIWYGEYPPMGEHNIDGWFTDSLDACLKCLVPKLSCEYSYSLFQDWMESTPENKHWEVEIYPDAIRDGYKWLAQAEAETPALALCRAIEVLIDESKNAT